MQWTCQLVVKTGTPPLTGEVDGPSPGGVTLFQGDCSPPLRGGLINLWTECTFKHLLLALICRRFIR